MSNMLQTASIASCLLMSPLLHAAPPRTFDELVQQLQLPETRRLMEPCFICGMAEHYYGCAVLDDDNWGQCREDVCPQVIRLPRLLK